MATQLKFIFLILPEVHLLDLAGADQVLSEAIDFGADFTIEYAGIEEAVKTSAGLGLHQLKHFTEITICPGDFIIIPGSRVRYIESGVFKENKALFEWLRSSYDKGVNMVSICVGAFALAEAGLLNGVTCTTHFQLTDSIQKQYPKLLIKHNVLFVSEGRIHTSAGIASGIDLMLHLLEKLTDSHFAHKVARELVIYNRRNGLERQDTAYFNFRNHVHQGIHVAQDHIIAYISKKHSLPELAEIAHMSERNFTRIFKKETGITVTEYITKIRIEKIKELQKSPDFSKKQMAEKIGLESEKQVERLLKMIG